jgi:short-subunit dehydrogenase
MRLAPRAGGAALVTGASSGIGEAFARKLAARGFDLVLAARTASRLEALAAELAARHGVNAIPFAVDLATDDGPARLFTATEGSGREVDLLVNDAGFALHGALADLPVDRVKELLHVNVLAATELAQRHLAAMRSRRRGGILNVASTQAFLPDPYMAAYGASKAFLASLSQALSVETEGDGVTVTCLCPGFTRTGFYDAAGMKGPKGTPFPEMRAEDVAEIGLHALERGRALVVPHPFDRLWIFAGRFAPRALPPLLAARLFRKLKG